MKAIDNTSTKAVYDLIQEFAESPLKETRVIDSIDLGKFVRQGDVYLQRISDDIDLTNHRVSNDYKLAPGNSKGSQHTVHNSTTVYVSDSDGAAMRVGDDKFKIMGPVVKSNDRFTVSHPEHADFSLPGGTYQVSYQVDMRTMQRVLD